MSKDNNCTRCNGDGFVRSPLSTPLIGIDEDCQHCEATGKEPAAGYECPRCGDDCAGACHSRYPWHE